MAILENFVSTCPHDQVNETVARSTYVTNGKSESSENPENYINPLKWCFIIAGGSAMAVAIVMVALALLRIEEKVQSHYDDSAETRPEEPMKDVWMLFIIISFYYFCCGPSEIVYQGYIYSIAFCSELGFDVSQASLLNSLFWAGFAIGRGAGIILSKFFRPSTIIIFDLIGTTSAMTAMSIWGNYFESVTWTMTFFHGLFVATLYSSGVSWTSQVTNMSGRYAFVYNVGSSIGLIALMPAGGALFENDPFSVIYLVNGICVANVLAFLFMNVIVKLRKVASQKP